MLLSAPTKTLLRYTRNLQRSSAIQQGFLNISIFLLSLFLLSIITYFSVQRALATRLDNNLQQEMAMLVEQVLDDDTDAAEDAKDGTDSAADNDDDDDDEYTPPPKTLNQARLSNKFSLVFPRRDLRLNHNKIFRKTGFSNQEFMQTSRRDDTHYRLLVQRKAGRVFIVGENNDNDQEILTIVMSSFLLNGLIALIFTALLVIILAIRSHRQIRSIEHVLQHAAEGDLKQRIGSSNKNNDLAHVSEQIDTMLSRLETSMSAMTDISANIAHELKTPISRLRHDLMTALDKTDQGQDAKEALNNAYDESGQITETFDALLRIAQIEGGARRSHFAPLDLNAIINTVTDIYVEVAEDAGMSLALTPQALAISASQPEQPMMVHGDKELLVQMLANLVENSIRYCPVGTAIAIGASTEGERIKLVVSDNGPGIAEADRAHVFQRLYRADKSRTDRRGTGLGLSLVKAIVELHNAEIALSDHKPGLLVSLCFPCYISK